MPIHASPERLARLYLDYKRWSFLFPATIRGVRLLREGDHETTVEVDHRTEGAVVNVIRPRSPTVIELEEFKPRFDAPFTNRFEREGTGARYILDADVRLHMPFALLGPLVKPIVRRRMRRFVLQPMQTAAETTVRGYQRRC
jgi:hypothetical protein